MRRPSLLLAWCSPVLAAALAHAQDWHPVAGHLQTKWAAEVSPSNALPEHPRPLQRRASWSSLNGLWDYAITADDAKPPAAWQGKILVPYPIESSLSGIGRTLQSGQRLWYRRQFTGRVDGRWRRLLLHFEAVDWEAEVFLDGKSLGMHRGGYDPFTLDVTGAMNGTHELMVAVRDPSDAGPQPRGKQVRKPNGIWYTPSTGIWQTVWLEGVSGIASFDVSADRRTGTVTVRVETEGDVAGMRLRARVFDKAQVVAERNGRPGQPLTLEVPHPRAWSPADPFLYGLDIALQADEVDPHSALGLVDQIGSEFAFRDIAIGPDAQGRMRILLNGEPLFQFGPLDQGFWPDGLYTAPTDAALRADVEAVKKMGGNMLRKHVKVEPERFYHHCDRLGVLVWQDMPSGDAAKDPAGFERELRAMIAARKRHPSIVTWVVFNEGWGQHDTERYVKLVRELDPTRLVDDASGWTDQKCGDLIDVHSYPGPAMAPPEAHRASVLGEFGGLGLPVAGHTWVEKDNWGYATFPDQRALTAEYVRRLHALRPLIAQGLSAAVYTQTTDVEIECNGWLTYDRAVWKIDPEQAAAAAKLLQEPFGSVHTVLPTAQEAPQRWRFTTQKPTDGWTAGSFDDSGWQQGNAGFGTAGTPGALIGTTWDTADLWVRRTFELADPALVEPQFVLHHDEDCEIWLNGGLALSLPGYTTSYQLEPMSEAAQKLLRKGTNTLAVHCHQTRGGQYLDVGVAEILPAPGGRRAK